MKLVMIPVKVYVLWRFMNKHFIKAFGSEGETVEGMLISLQIEVIFRVKQETY